MLKRRGVPRDGILLVHSAFRGMGREGFDPAAVVDVLAEHMTPGTLVMPTMSWRFVKPANPVFDELATPSNTGVLTELFRRGPATHRSLHPTHSVAARGPAAARLTDGHHLDDTPCGRNSPFGRLAEAESWVLMMGISMDCCTLLHHAEEITAPDHYVRPPDQTETYLCRARDGRTVDVRLRRHLFLRRDYFRMQDALAERGALSVDLVSSTVCRLYRAATLVALARQALEARPDALLASPGGRYRMM
ncbi:AAC(3) family N-acetyltransferase [Magnetospirillum sp. UT-4]|uniref:AAC(3) family N-acetyltransferase n=1 Tax=Magnetospirillum sp. UT-4 TaxID=2681467 RepID=UPI001386592F|nr:AAC(3) family N-acetyltransferase [Magnetospirillum sp. UT-4]CAA7612100.1 Acetyltransferase [Magnetospirillum sp. UT-4]